MDELGPFLPLVNSVANDLFTTILRQNGSGTVCRL